MNVVVFDGCAWTDWHRWGNHILHVVFFSRANSKSMCILCACCTRDFMAMKQKQEKSVFSSGYWTRAFTWLTAIRSTFWRFIFIIGRRQKMGCSSDWWSVECIFWTFVEACATRPQIVYDSEMESICMCLSVACNQRTPISCEGNKFLSMRMKVLLKVRTKKSIEHWSDQFAVLFTL